MGRKPRFEYRSDKYYRENNTQGIVDIDFILNILSKDRVAAVKSYINFMDENMKEDISAFEDVDIIGKVNTSILDDYLKVEKKSLDEIIKMHNSGK